MSDVYDEYRREPVDRVAVRVTRFRGVAWEPDKKVQTNDSETPLRIRPVCPAERGAQGFCDLTGCVFGRFTVLGPAEDYPAQWVVRCTCGRYSTRRARAIKNERNSVDRCEHCRHLAYLQRRGSSYLPELGEYSSHRTADWTGWG